MVLTLVFVETNFAQEPSWTWAKSEGSIGNEYSNAVCTDESGNVYVTGTFQGETTTIGDFTLYSAAEGSLDIFVAKYDASGNVLWAKSGGGTGDDYAYGICVDTQGGVYITGYFRGPSVSFGAIELFNTEDDCYDAFLTKFDTAGNVVWGRSINGTRCVYAMGVDADLDGNVYITGYFGYGSSNAIFGDYTLVNLGDMDGFVSKYDTDGNAIWATQIGGTGIDLCEDLYIGANGDIYVTGSFENTAMFGDNTVASPNDATYQEIFVARFAPDGSNVWAKCALVPLFGNYASGKGVASDLEGNVYMTGYFQHSLSFGEDTLSTAGNIEVFLAKYDSSGNALWGRMPGGTGTDYGMDVRTDAEGNIFTTGYFQSSYLNFGGIPLINANTGYNDVFVVGYDSSGEVLWAHSTGGQDHDYGMSLGVDMDDNVYLTGYYGSYSLDFSNTTIINSGSNDIFLAKISGDTAVSTQNADNFNGTRIFPNPFSDKIYVQSDGYTLITIYDLSSRKVFERQFVNNSTFDLSELASGLYVYEINRHGTMSVGKLIKK